MGEPDGPDRPRGGRINIIDLVVILVVLVLVLGAGYKIVHRRSAAGPAETVRFEVLAPEMLPQAATEIKAGDHLVSGNSLTSAVVTAVKVRPAMLGVTTAAGTRARVPDPYLKDVLVWVQAKVPASGGTVSVAGQAVRAGGNFVLKTRFFDNEKATVLTISPQPASGRPGTPTRSS